MIESHDLERFIRAQDAGVGAESVYDRALTELRAGLKQSHWMWFVFPQFQGLGESEMSKTYAIASLAEAAAYVAHPVLGPRLRTCLTILNGLQDRTAFQIFGRPDDRKLRSSLTLFAHATDDNTVFMLTLVKFFPGGFDKRTLRALGIQAAT
ncbi:DUF1810 domain-containing protein [Phenylobacterium sp.]|uniref:DUF1810 domain-containing protein n=1 Tax=Phenylobacterium sp. TaxID=1871053 RepID=UPI0025D4CEFE|nr:DUF1810 domain-containing protein [Phenylobacterium sp.]